MQLLRGRTRTEAVNRWTAKEACFYSAAVVRGSIEVATRQLMAYARAAEGTAPRNRRVNMAAVVCVSDPGIKDL